MELRLACTATLLFLGGICTCVSAQIVNIEDQRKGFDTLGWFGQLDLGGNLNRNSTTTLSLNGALRVDHRAERHALLGIADYRLVQVSGKNGINAGFAHIRYAYYFNDRWRWEAFTQVQYNEQLRLGLRSLVGTGPRLKLVAGKRNRVYVGALYMYEYDELAERSIFYRDHRLSSYLSFNLYPFSRLSLTNTTYYQPILPDFSLPRISSVMGLSLQLTGSFSLTSTFNVTHDALLNRGLDEVPETTYSWVNGLRYVF
jgi:hypothetical protein